MWERDRQRQRQIMINLYHKYSLGTRTPCALVCRTGKILINLRGFADQVPRCPLKFRRSVFVWPGTWNGYLYRYCRNWLIRYDLILIVQSRILYSEDGDRNVLYYMVNAWGFQESERNRKRKTFTYMHVVWEDLFIFYFVLVVVLVSLEQTKYCLFSFWLVLHVFKQYWRCHTYLSRSANCMSFANIHYVMSGIASGTERMFD